MKRIAIILLCLAMIGVLAGCGGDGSASSKTGNSSAGVADVLEAGIAEAESAAQEDATDQAAPESLDETEAQTAAETPAATEDQPETEEETEKPEQQTTNPQDTQNTNLEISEEEYAKMTGTEGVDIDLTVLSGTMVYSEVYNMMISPEDFKGKIVKMSGNFAVYTDEETGKNYYACIIQDATACCAQGIEFELAGDYQYPEDYPDIDDIVTVVGSFDTYKEGEYQYCTLRNASYAG